VIRTPARLPALAPPAPPCVWLATRVGRRFRPRRWRRTVCPL